MHEYSWSIKKPAHRHQRLPAPIKRIPHSKNRMSIFRAKIRFFPQSFAQAPPRIRLPMITYKTIRAIVTRTYNLYSSVWCNANLALAAASVSRCSLVCDEGAPRSDLREASSSDMDIYSCRRINFSPLLHVTTPYFVDILRRWPRGLGCLRYMMEV